MSRAGGDRRAPLSSRAPPHLRARRGAGGASRRSAPDCDRARPVNRACITAPQVPAPSPGRGRERMLCRPGPAVFASAGAGARLNAPASSRGASAADRCRVTDRSRAKTAAAAQWADLRDNLQPNTPRMLARAGLVVAVLASIVQLTIATWPALLPFIA